MCSYWKPFNHATRSASLKFLHESRTWNYTLTAVRIKLSKYVPVLCKIHRLKPSTNLENNLSSGRRFVRHVYLGFENSQCSKMCCLIPAGHPAFPKAMDKGRFTLTQTQNSRNFQQRSSRHFRTLLLKKFHEGHPTSQCAHIGPHDMERSRDFKSCAFVRERIHFREWK